MIEKLKLLWLSDTGAGPTGYGSVTKNILNRLATNHFWDCTNLAQHHFGCDLIPPIKLPDKESLHFRIMSGGRQLGAQDILDSVIFDEKPDVFGILLDTFMLAPWFLQKHISAPSFFYFPSDGGGSWDANDTYGGLPFTYGMSCSKILQKVNLPIAMSRFGQKQVLDHHGIKSKYIPHGVNLKHFFAYDEEGKIKAKSSFGIGPDVLVIGDNFRNQGRKFAARKLLIFKEFIKEYKKPVILFFNCDPFDVSATFNMNELARGLGIERYIKFTGMHSWKGLSIKRLRDFYNSLDFKLDTTSGEGFGLTIIESLACEVPVVITDYTTSKELIMDDGQSGLLIPLKDSILGTQHVFRGICDIKEGVKQCLEMANNVDLRKKFGRVGAKKIKEHYDYDKLAVVWDKTLRGLANGKI